MIDRFIAWFQSHKAVLGSFFLGLATVVGGIGVEYRSDDFIHAAAVITIVGAALTGAGAAKSDQFYRERLEVIKTQLDRRNGDSLIPVNDLKKLVEKASPDADRDPAD